MMGRAPHPLLRAANALLMSAATAWLLAFLGETLGEAIAYGLVVGIALFLCTTAFVGRNAIMKFDIAMGTLVVTLIALSYAFTALIDGETKSPEMGVLLLWVFLLAHPALLSRLHLHSRRTEA